MTEGEINKRTFCVCCNSEGRCSVST